MKFGSSLLAVCLALSVAPALAQSGAFSTTGTVERLDAATIAIRNEQGAVETFPLAANLLVIRMRAATLADIRPNDFVASAAVRREDGKLHSTELRIFPEALRGLGEGQRPMNDARAQTMTNATVTGAAIVNGSNTIKVRFAGGESELILDPGVPVTRLEAVGKELLKAGMKVRVQGSRGEGPTISRVTIQQD